LLSGTWQFGNTTISTFHRWLRLFVECEHPYALFPEDSYSDESNSADPNTKLAEDDNAILSVGTYKLLSLSKSRSQYYDILLTDFIDGRPLNVRLSDERIRQRTESCISSNASARVRFDNSASYDLNGRTAFQLQKSSAPTGHEMLHVGLCRTGRRFYGI
jgi:hypothetical protein